MKINTTMQAIFCLLLLSACRDGRSSYPDALSFSLSDFKETLSLTGDSLVFDDILLKPVAMHLADDSILIMKNINTELTYHLFNVVSGKKVGECLPFGIGPGEMLDPRLVNITEDEIWIYDKNRRILMCYEKNVFLRERRLAVTHRIEFKDFCNNLALIPGKGFVSSVFDAGDRRFALFTFDGDTIGYKGEFPAFPGLDTHIEQIEGFVGDLLVNKEGSRVFTSCMRTDLLEYYDSDMNLLKRLHGPDHFFPEIYQSGDRIRSNLGKDRTAYNCPIAAGDRIFILYSGKVFDPKDAHHYLKDKILVFDWDGTPLQCLRLDIPVFYIAVDERSGFIYGLTDVPESHIVRFKYSITSDKNLY